MRPDVVLEEIFLGNVGQDLSRNRVPFAVLIDLVHAGPCDLQKRADKVRLGTIECGLEHEAGIEGAVGPEDDETAEVQPGELVKFELWLAAQQRLRVVPGIGMRSQEPTQLLSSPCFMRVTMVRRLPLILAPGRLT